MMKHNASFSEAIYFRTLVASWTRLACDETRGIKGWRKKTGQATACRFLLPTVLCAQKGMSVKGADERIWGLQSSVWRPYITHLPWGALCYQYLVVPCYWFLSLLEWQRGLKYNTFWRERYIFNGNMRSRSLRVSWERFFHFRDWTRAWIFR